MVANKVFGDTLAVLAHELVVAARVVKDAADLHTLVSSIRTVFVAIALPVLRNAHVRSWTLKCIRAAGFGFALAVLISAVTTVVGSIAHPAVGNAAMVPTLELRGGAEFITVSLICSILTVVLLITSPAHGDATAAGTSEERSRTLCFSTPWAVSFI